MLSFSKNLGKKIILFLILLMIIAGCSDSPTTTPNPVQPTPTTGSIRGLVSDQFAVIPNAYLKLYLFQGSNSTENLYTATANDRGEYVIYNIPPGEGMIEAWISQTGHDDGNENPIANYQISISAGKTTVQDIKSGHYDAYGKQK